MEKGLMANKTKKVEKVSKKKLPEKQITGMIDPVNQKSVYEIMGFNDFPYPQKTIEEYRALIDEMNLADLQRHSIEVANIIPTSASRSILIDRLEKEYVKKRYAYVEVKNVGRQLSAQDEADIKKLLRQ